MLAGFDPYSDNSPPSASSPSPLGKGSGIGGNAFQHRIPRTALYRWPAAPLPRNAVAAMGVRGPHYPSAHVRAVGPSEASFEESAGGACPVLLWGPASPDDSSASRRHERQIAHGTATGAAIKDTRCFIPRSISNCWALPSGLGKPNLIPCTGI